VMLREITGYTHAFQVVLILPTGLSVLTCSHVTCVLSSVLDAVSTRRAW
jgi:hypothetical protein